MRVKALLSPGYLNSSNTTLHLDVVPPLRPSELSERLPKRFDAVDGKSRGALCQSHEQRAFHSVDNTLISCDLLRCQFSGTHGTPALAASRLDNLGLSAANAPEAERLFALCEDGG